MALSDEEVQARRRRRDDRMPLDSDWSAVRTLDTDHDAARARVAELERDLRVTVEARDLYRGRFTVADDRAASLQAEVERLKSAWAVSREAAATHQGEARDLRSALAESERKRAELLAQLEDDAREQKMQDGWDE